MLSGVVRLIANHRSSASSKAHQKSGPFAPPALPGLVMSETCSACTLLRPCPSPAQSAGSPGVGGATSDRYGLPPITRSTLTSVPCPLPRRIETGACVDCFPIPRGLPRYSGGSASATSLSRPAQASLALRPTGSLNRPRRPLSQGSGPSGCPNEPLASYQINRQLSGWNLPPLVLRAVGAHRIKWAKGSLLISLRRMTSRSLAVAPLACFSSRSN